MMTSGKFQLERVKGTPVSDEKLLSDLRVVANKLGITTVPQKKYREVGKYDDTTLSNRFGSWNKALIKAGLELSNETSMTWRSQGSMKMVLHKLEFEGGKAL